MKAAGQDKRDKKQSRGRGKRTIFIGDVHGCFAELKEMIHILSPQQGDRVILLGDLVNRGPHSAKVVRFVARQGYETLLGNHEVRYLRNLHLPHYKNLYEALGPALHRWIKKLPLYIVDKRFIAVHAGLQPGRRPASTSAKVLLTIRTWDSRGENLSDPANPPWYLFYKQKRPVFYGHWAGAGLNIRHNTFGLDSGCVYGHSLSAYILEEKSLIQVPAAEVYYV